MAWYRTGDKPLPEPIRTSATDLWLGLNKLKDESHLMLLYYDTVAA